MRPILRKRCASEIQSSKLTEFRKWLKEKNISQTHFHDNCYNNIPDTLQTLSKLYDSWKGKGSFGRNINVCIPAVLTQLLSIAAHTLPDVDPRVLIPSSTPTQTGISKANRQRFTYNFSLEKRFPFAFDYNIQFGNQEIAIRQIGIVHGLDPTLTYIENAKSAISSELPKQPGTLYLETGLDRFVPDAYTTHLKHLAPDTNLERWACQWWNMLSPSPYLYQKENESKPSSIKEEASKDAVTIDHETGKTFVENFKTNNQLIISADIAARLYIDVLTLAAPWQQGGDYNDAPNTNTDISTQISLDSIAFAFKLIDEIGKAHKNGNASDMATLNILTGRMHSRQMQLYLQNPSLLYNTFTQLMDHCNQQLIKNGRHEDGFTYQKAETPPKTLQALYAWMQVNENKLFKA